jgi:hypothetical protein
MPSEFHTGSGSTNFVTGVQYKDETGKTSSRLRTSVGASRSPSRPRSTRRTSTIGISSKRRSRVTSSPAPTPSSAGSRASSCAPTPTRRSASRRRRRSSAAAGCSRPRSPWRKRSWAAGPVHERAARGVLCLASSGPLSIDERKENRESAKDGFLSRATTMERNGVDDVDAELGRMAGEPDARADLAVKQANALKTAHGRRRIARRCRAIPRYPGRSREAADEATDTSGGGIQQ